MIGFLVGIVVGAAVGVFAMGLVVAAKENRQIEDALRDEEERPFWV